MAKNVDPFPLRELSQALAWVDNPQLVEEFLHSIFTENETKEISSRWILVRLLEQGLSQRTISRELGLSLCKITRGSRELKKKNSAFARMIKKYKLNKINQGSKNA